MKRLAVIGLALGVLALGAAPSEAGYPWRGGVYVGVGPWYWPGPFYAYGYPYYRYGPYGYPPYAYPSVTIVEPKVYIEQPPLPSAPPAPTAFWYYCASAGGYYPDVEACPEEWIKVPPRSP